MYHLANLNKSSISRRWPDWSSFFSRIYMNKWTENVFLHWPKSMQTWGSSVSGYREQSKILDRTSWPRNAWQFCEAPGIKIRIDYRIVDSNEHTLLGAEEILQVEYKKKNMYELWRMICLRGIQKSRQLWWLWSLFCHFVSARRFHFFPFMKLANKFCRTVFLECSLIGYSKTRIQRTSIYLFPLSTTSRFSSKAS
jgi:hypothetical protein